MARDSLFGERIVWEGRSNSVTVPFANKVMAVTSGVVSLITLCYAVVIAKSLEAPVGGMVLFAGWSAAIALGSWRPCPLWWQSQVDLYIGDRTAASSGGAGRCGAPSRAARSAPRAGAGAPASLVTAISSSCGPSRPARCGEPSPSPFATSTLPTASGLWCEASRSGRRSARVTDRSRSASTWASACCGPANSRRRGRCAGVSPGRRASRSRSPSCTRCCDRCRRSCACCACTRARPRPREPARGRRHPRHAPAARHRGRRRLRRALPPRPPRARDALLRDQRARAHPPRQRGAVPRPLEHRLRHRRSTWKKLHDVFLVIDGPRARALAPSGAFGGSERDDALRPVFTAIEDAETVGQILRMQALDKAA